jgi:hypothetical protein
MSVLQLFPKEEYSLSKYLHHFFNNMKFYVTTFFIQYEKFVFHHMYGIYPDTDSDADEYDIVDDEEENEESENEYIEDEEEDEHVEDEQEDDQENEEFCKENCDCKLCFYFKDLVEHAYY